ncbi:hypothetical protein SEA_HORTUS1_91 [Microbacterium phage Hortus1]|nr:hypothetical protein SEA_HORTUS1_91 [Microbacterium phage Hortus1]AWY05661.1 hypothetical protein SEA_OLINDD_91 [Microbacterium phage OlinDD]
MWLEAMYASMSIAGMCGVALGINALFPAETKRFLRIVRAEIGSRVPARRKRLTLEVALHTQAEVDLKWWDEEFAKLERAIPGKNWYQMMGSKIDSMAVPTAAEITRGDLVRWKAGGVTQVTQGDLTFNVSSVLDSHIALSERRAEEKVREELVEFERARLDLARRAPYLADATPPGMPHSLREAQQAGISLATARDRSVLAFHNAPGVHSIPRDISVRGRSRIEQARTWSTLVLAVSWANLMLAKHGRPDECEFCEYEEVKTYTSPHVKRYRTSECWECKERSVRATTEYAAKRVSMWSIPDSA